MSKEHTADPLSELVKSISDRGARQVLRCLGLDQLTPAERDDRYLLISSIIADCVLTLIFLEATNLRDPLALSSDTAAIAE